MGGCVGGVGLFVGESVTLVGLPVGLHVNESPVGPTVGTEVGRIVGGGGVGVVGLIGDSVGLRGCTVGDVGDPVGTLVPQVGLLVGLHDSVSPVGPTLGLSLGFVGFIVGGAGVGDVGDVGDVGGGGYVGDVGGTVGA